MMRTILSDLRHAWRGLRKRPGFTVTILATLALGIGANTTIFSVVEAVLLRPLPYEEPEHLVQIWTQFPEHDAFEFPASEAEYVDYRDQSTLFEDIAAYSYGAVTLTGRGGPERLAGAATTASLWSILGVEAVLGRTFTLSEDQPGAGKVAILGHDLWQRRFGGEREVLDSSILLDGEPYTVVGVMPAGFRFPDRDTELWVPLGLDEAAIENRFGHYLSLVGRTVPGASVADVRNELEVVVGRWREQHEHVHPMHAVDLGEQVFGDTRGPLWLLMTATGLVLLIACVNVAGLLLARGEERRREVAVKTALGAGRWRLVRQLMTESGLLGGLGGLLGMVLAGAGVVLLRAWQPVDLPRLEQVGIDGSVLFFAFTMSLATAALFGLVPAFRGSRFDLAQTLHEGSLRNTAGGVRQRLRGALVVAEIALAVVLVAGAGLMVQSLWRLQRVDPGLRPEGVLTARISLPERAYDGAPEITAFHHELLEGLRSVPGVEAASLVNHPPFGSEARLESFYVEGRPREVQDEGIGSDLQMVTPAYFETVGLPVLQGRGFNDTDRGGAPRVAILTESLARTVFPDTDPIGQRITILAADPEEPSFEIVGLVADIPHFGAASGIRPQLYLPLEQSLTEIRGMARTVSVMVGSSVDPRTLLDDLRRQVWSLDADLAISEETTLQAALDRTLARPRFTTALLAGFGTLALVLAAVGIYGLLAHLVGLRERELGIRAALGASRGSLVAMVTHQGLVLASAGLVIGMAISLLVNRRLEALLFETSPTDWTTLAVVPWVLAVVAGLACLVPARRAASVDPVHTLRQE